MYLDPSQCSDWLKQAPPVVRSTANLQALIHLPRTKQDALVPAQQRLATLIEDCFDWAVIANNNNNNNDVMRGID
jgi:hypothetical protein